MAAFRRCALRCTALLAIAALSAFGAAARAEPPVPADDSTGAAAGALGYGPEETPCWFAYDRATAYCRNNPIPLLRAACKGVATLAYMACAWKATGGHVADR
jgi:hypothetical protein